MNIMWLSSIIFFLVFASPPNVMSQEKSVDMYLNSWKNSQPVQTHGTMVERAILTPGDPLNPPRPGACLSICKRFSRGILEGFVQTTPTVLRGEQEIIYVVSGKGRIETGSERLELEEGVAALLPPGIEFTIRNETEAPIEMLIVVESFPADKAPRRNILIRNSHTQPVLAGGHWAHIVRPLFGDADGLGNLHSVLIVSIDGMNIGEPHAHGAGTEEVWYQLKGTSIAFLGEEIRKQEPGTAYMIPPTGKITHSNINHKDTPMQWFYFARYGK